MITDFTMQTTTAAATGFPLTAYTFLETTCKVTPLRERDAHTSFGDFAKVLFISGSSVRNKFRTVN